MADRKESPVRYPLVIHGGIGFDLWSRYRRTLSAYATTFRYSLTPMPKIDDLQRILATLLELHKTARTELLTEAG